MEDGQEDDIGRKDRRLVLPISNSDARIDPRLRPL